MEIRDRITAARNNWEAVEYGNGKPEDACAQNFVFGNWIKYPQRGFDTD